MQGVEIYNICCQAGQVNNQVVCKAFQMTDKAVLKSIYKPRIQTGWAISSTQENAVTKALESRIKVKRKLSLHLILRDWVWKLGHWKKNKAFNLFLEQIKPDVIYLPIYSARYMCDVQNYIIDKLKVPVIGHITDDVYSYRKSEFLGMRWYRFLLRKKLKKLIGRCEYLEVFAENMKTEYEEIFKKPCYLIGKGVDDFSLNNWQNSFEYKDKYKFVYTGNISKDRFETLLLLGKALETKQGVLEIYSATILTPKQKTAMSKISTIIFKGKIGKEELKKVQKQADFLVHVEGFSKRAIEDTKMSFSTKIIDYMQTGKPILAIGDDKINSIAVLKSNKIAVVIAQKEELGETVFKLLNNNLDINSMQLRVFEYLQEKRNIKKIQLEMLGRLKGLLKDKNESITN